MDKSCPITFNKTKIVGIDEHLWKKSPSNGIVKTKMEGTVTLIQGSTGNSLVEFKLTSIIRWKQMTEPCDQVQIKGGTQEWERKKTDYSCFQYKIQLCTVAFSDNTICKVHASPYSSVQWDCCVDSLVVSLLHCGKWSGYGSNQIAILQEILQQSRLHLAFQFAGPPWASFGQ